MSIDMDSIIEAQEQYLTCEATEQVIILLGEGGVGGALEDQFHKISKLPYNILFNTRTRVSLMPSLHETSLLEVNVISQ